MFRVGYLLRGTYREKTFDSTAEANLAFAKLRRLGLPVTTRKGYGEVKYWGADRETFATAIIKAGNIYQDETACCIVVTWLETVTNLKTTSDITFMIDGDLYDLRPGYKYYNDQFSEYPEKYNFWVFYRDGEELTELRWIVPRTT